MGDCFVEAHEWADNSNSFLVRVSKQRTGEPIWIGDWYCIYDIPSQKITLDLSTLNRNAFKRVKPDQSIGRGRNAGRNLKKS